MENIIRQHSSKCGDIFLVFLRGRKVAAAKKTIKAFSCGEGKKRSLNATILGRFCGGESSKGRACSISPLERVPGKIKPLVTWHLNIFSTGPTIGWWTQAWLIRAEHKSERRKKRSFVREKEKWNPREKQKVHATYLLRTRKSWKLWMGLEKKSLRGHQFRFCLRSDWPN